jgi:membrane-bound inhibitor of C-type lysozyme
MRLIALLAALPLTACATQPPPAPTEEVFAWTCPGGQHFTVQYDDGYTLAFVKLGQLSYRLPAKMAASGARYSNGKVEFWEHHSGALLHGTPAGELVDCALPEDGSK